MTKRVEMNDHYVRVIAPLAALAASAALVEIESILR
jgi:hypothetical protein